MLDVSEFRHMRINHREQFADRGNHINGIENFWNQAKRHLRRYNGIPRAHFPLYLKECEWRFNYRPANRLLATLENLAQRKSIDPYLGQPQIFSSLGPPPQIASSQRSFSVCLAAGRVRLKPCIVGGRAHS